MTTGQQLTTPGGLLAGAVTGGNGLAIQAGAIASDLLSLGGDVGGVQKSVNFGSLAALASDAYSLFSDMTVQVSVPGSSITVGGTVAPVDLVPSQISVPETLTYSGGGGGYEARSPSHFDDGGDDDN
jgi:hypothetical protein